MMLHLELEISWTNLLCKQFNEALKRTAILLVATIAFGIGTGATLGRKSMFEFFTSYLVEQSLGVDNLIVVSYHYFQRFLLAPKQLFVVCVR